MTVDIGLARQIDAQTFGVPGRRTFRLRIIGAGEQSAGLWMEKEQFQALSLALSQLLAQLGRSDESQAQPVDAFPDVPDHDFQVGRMAMGLEPRSGVVVLQVFAAADIEAEHPALTLSISQDHCSSLNGQLRRIVAAGRPVCPLCGVPIDGPSHGCIRTNGHSRQPIPEPGQEDEP